MIMAEHSDSSHESGFNSAPNSPAISNQSNGAVLAKGILRPSALTAKAEQLRTDKVEINHESDNSVSVQKEKDSNGASAESALTVTRSVSEIEPTASSTNVVSSTTDDNYFRKFLKPSETLSTSYIFGANIQSDSEITSTALQKTCDNGSDHDPDNGSTLFTVVAKSFSEAGEKPGLSVSDTDSGKDSGGLVESAEKYELTHKNQKPELSQVEVKTGEEGEEHVLHLMCKLYIFQRDTKNWQERGQVILKLNDDHCSKSNQLRSRLICRSQGCLKVLVNTFLWSGMNVEQVGAKRIRLNALDEDQQVIAILLGFNSSTEAQQLSNALNARLLQLKSCSSSRTSIKRKIEDTRSASPDLAGKKHRLSLANSNSVNEEDSSDSSGS